LEGGGPDGSLWKLISTGCEEIPASMFNVIGSKGSKVDTSMPPPKELEGGGAMEIVFAGAEEPLLLLLMETLD
jgi:hypothetical protein